MILFSIPLDDTFSQARGYFNLNILDVQFFKLAIINMALSPNFTSNTNSFMMDVSII